MIGCSGFGSKRLGNRLNLLSSELSPSVLSPKEHQFAGAWAGSSSIFSLPSFLLAAQTPTPSHGGLTK